MLRMISLIALSASLAALDIAFQPGEAAIHMDDVAGFTVVIPRVCDLRGDLILERRTAQTQESFHVTYVAIDGARRDEFRDQVYATAGSATPYHDTIMGVPTHGLSQVVAIPKRQAYLVIRYQVINDNRPAPEAFPYGFGVRVTGTP